MKEQEKRNNQEGVTLVALVVTIIILIILAGVSINLLLGENGIITQAQKAKEDTEQAKIEEEKALNSVYGYLNIDPNNYVRPEEMESLREDYNNFKNTIAQAITESGIPTQNTDSAETMANSIKNLGGGTIQRIKLGSNQSNIDCTSIEGWNTLRIENFAIIPTSITGGGRAGDVPSFNRYATANPTMSYNNTTGKLTISGTSNSGHFDKGDGSGGIMWTEDWSCGMNYDVYVYIVSK